MNKFLFCCCYIKLNMFRGSLGKVVFLSAVAMLFTAISNTDLGIIGQLAAQNGNSWVGTLSIVMIFLGSGLGTFGNFYIGRWKYRRIILLGACGWIFFVGFSVLFLFIGFEDSVIAVILVGSLICGLTVSMYYNGINNYVNECGKADNLTSAYFGLNTCIIQTSNILGNSLSALLIVPLGQQTYSILMLALVFAITLIFFSLKEPPVLKQSLIQSKIDQNDRENIQKSVKASSPMPLWFYWCFALSGVMISFVYSEFSVAFYQYFPEMEKEELNRITFQAFMIEGCGQFIGGLALFLFEKKIRSVPLAHISSGLLFLFSVGLLWVGFTQQDVTLIEVGAFMVGLADCFCFALGLSIAGRWDQKGISLFNFGQSFTVAVIATLNIFFDLSILFYIYIFVFIASSSVLIRYRRLLKQSEQVIFIE